MARGQSAIPQHVARELAWALLGVDCAEKIGARAIGVLERALPQVCGWLLGIRVGDGRYSVHCAGAVDADQPESLSRVLGLTHGTFCLHTTRVGEAALRPKNWYACRLQGAPHLTTVSLVGYVSVPDVLTVSTVSNAAHAIGKALHVAWKIERLRTISTHDPLTGLLNRRGITELVAQQRAVRRRNPLSVIMFDLDNFKGINDELGHHAGDQALRCVVEAALASIRPGDRLARMGGDEFVLFVQGDTRIARQVAERVAEAIRRCEFQFAGQHVPLSLTYGVAPFATDTSFNQAVRAADALMLQGKARAKAGVPHLF